MYNDHPVYTCSSCSSTNELWYGLNGGWYIGDDHITGSYGIKSEAATYCPEDAGKGAWKYYAGEPTGNVLDSDADVRCSDCSKYPTQEECITCCSTVALTGDGIPSQLKGTYEIYTATPEYGGRPVYITGGQSGQYCMWHFANMWMIGSCSNVGKGSFNMGSGTTTAKCPNAAPKGTWAYGANKGEVACTQECTSDPPAVPTGATSNWDGSTLTAGTQVTYTCTGKDTTAKAICDPTSQAWVVDGGVTWANLCSGGATPPPPNPTTAGPSTQPPGPTTQPPTAAPTTKKTTKKPTKPSKSCAGMTAYVKSQTLKKKSRVKTAMVCQTYCAKIKMANSFMWKSHKQVKRRLCYCKKITLAWRKGKRGKTVNGPLNC